MSGGRAVSNRTLSAADLIFRLRLFGSEVIFYEFYRIIIFLTTSFHFCFNRKQSVCQNGSVFGIPLKTPDEFHYCSLIISIYNILFFFNITTNTFTRQSVKTPLISPCHSRYLLVTQRSKTPLVISAAF